MIDTNLKNETALNHEPETQETSEPFRSSGGGNENQSQVSNDEIRKVAPQGSEDLKTPILDQEKEIGKKNEEKSREKTQKEIKPQDRLLQRHFANIRMRSMGNLKRRSN